MYRLLITIFFLTLTFSASFSALAQEKYNAETDKKTYELYMKSSYDELIKAGETAIESGTDFYYLRMRMGISFYQEENYMSAIPHFEKAVFFKPKDTVALEYLYYSYVFSGNKSEANLLSNRMPASLKRKTGYSAPEFFTGAYTEGGYAFDNNYNSVKENNFLGNGRASGTQNVFKSETYLNLSLMHTVGDRVTIFHGYNNIAVSSTRQFNDLTGGKKEFDASVKQNEYYFNLGVYMGKGFNLTGAVHYLNVNAMDVSPPVLIGQPFVNTTVASSESVETIGVTKRTGHTEVGYSLLISNLNGGRQAQNAFTFVWYPLGNMNLYNVSNFVFHSNKANDSSDNVTGFIFDEKIGFKVMKKLWLEAVLTAGNIFNYSESAGFIVYNNLNKIKYKAGFNLIYPVSGKVELSFRYLLLSQEYEAITTDLNFITTTKTNNLLTHKLIGGIKWTF